MEDVQAKKKSRMSFNFKHLSKKTNGGEKDLVSPPPLIEFTTLVTLVTWAA